MSNLHKRLAEVDPEIASLVDAELDRQRRTLDFVASESVTPLAVMEAQGSVLTAKYADGYPGARENDTCEVIDEIEQLAIDRAKALFRAEHANVQPYSGANANMAVLHALLEPGETVLGWDFEHGGHPSHYFWKTFAGRYFDAQCYGVRSDDRLVDMDQVESVAKATRPKVVIAGWSCYSRWLDFRRFREICDAVGAYLVVDMAHFAGLVAAGLHPDPVPYADACTMTVHKTLGGARGGAIVCREALAERIDQAVYPGTQGCPLEHVVAGKAVSFSLAASDEHRARSAQMIEGARTIAAAIEAAPDRAGASVVTGGTDVHQLLVDLAPSGRDSFAVLAELNRIGISASAIRLPYDDAPSECGSGLRIGATALAGRGFGAAAFEETARILVDALAVAGRGDDRALAHLGGDIQALLAAFPLYPDR